MDYLYEQLGDERFQELCQALLTKEMPNTQCFPIGQRDAGRDAISYMDLRNGEKSFSVFQVKYIRKPYAEKDPHKRILELLDEEIPKLKELIPKGAKAYHLITNVPGTAYPESGSIDRSQQILDDNLPVPTFCWWRDDLNRRLDNAYDLKWVYPEVMAGTDMLRLIVEAGLNEDKERRTYALRAFLRAQYNEDEKVRFKQVDLQNNLLDLFVDVPIGSKLGLERLVRNWRKPGGTPGEEEALGAATMLLDARVQRSIPQVILEGAPGQGKSTVAQYISQLHRVKILEREDVLKTLPPEHIPTGIRIPFKVDLRDLAVWLSKRDPFNPEDKEAAPVQWNKSLEAFLAAQIRHYSGGADFSVSDLHAVTKLSALLLVLDGLDEVADISERKDVVSAIVAGVNRLNELAASLQVVVTSRPTAFVESLGFPERDFPHFHLLSLSKPLIFEYASKWFLARGLNDRDAAGVRKILKQKIEQPHLRDLARNPMQLAILLSLIHTKGPSLPDKRTSLYDGYVDLFFNREAEKSEVVRNNRDVLIDIHRYLAWVLHYETEKRLHPGSISNERLHQLLTEYLISEGREGSLVSELFTGMVERIFFIVSRVEGTYEFEVQPLREYFAGRHLFETAPYSPTGDPRQGTRPDRFDGIAQNQYWLNVTRFFAGCYSKGELPSLVDRLQVLADKDDFRFTNYPKRVAATLLSDWVFSQDQRSTKEVVDLILDGVRVRHPFIRRRSLRHSAYSEESLMLANDCGREQLVEKCFAMLRQKPPDDYMAEIAHLAQANAGFEDVETMWFDEVSRAGNGNLTYWMRAGLLLGVLSKCSDVKLKEGLSGKLLKAKHLSIILNSGRSDFIEESEELSQVLVDGILDDGEGAFSGFRRTADVLTSFARIFQPYFYSPAFEAPAPIPLRQVMNRYSPYFVPDDDKLVSHIEAVAKTELLGKCEQVVRVADQELHKDSRQWATDLTCWENIIETSRSLWGERWAHFRLATVAAGIKSDDVVCKEYTELLDHSQPLCRRVRHARLKASAHRWWRSQIETATCRTDQLLVLVSFLSWASLPTKIKLLDLIQEKLERIPLADWELIAEALSEPKAYAKIRQSGSLRETNLPKRLSLRTVTALGNTLSVDVALELFTKYLSNYDGDDKPTLAFSEKLALAWVGREPAKWKTALPFIERRYAARKTDSENLHYIRADRLEASLPLDIAKQIAVNAKKYPRRLVYFAEERCELEVAKSIEPVGDIAKRERWFERTKRQRRR